MEVIFPFKLQTEIQEYEIEWDGPITEETDADVHVAIPVTHNPLDEVQYQSLTRVINPLKNSECYGIDIFLEVLEYVNVFVDS